MLKQILTLLFSLLLFFQSTVIAEETPEIQQEKSLDEAPETEEISEAQKEADEAEAAELREAGMEEEPSTD